MLELQMVVEKSFWIDQKPLPHKREERAQIL